MNIRGSYGECSRSTGGSRFSKVKTEPFTPFSEVKTEPIESGDSVVLAGRKAVFADFLLFIFRDV